MQEALRTMLRDGTIGGPKDNALILEIVRSDTMLPLFPVWDPQGILIGQALKSEDPLNTLSVLRSMKAEGLFNVRKYGVQTEADLKIKSLMTKIKILILKRLYPGLKEADDKTVDQFINRISMVTGELTTNKFRDMYDFSRAANGFDAPLKPSYSRRNLVPFDEKTEKAKEEAKNPNSN